MRTGGEARQTASNPFDDGVALTGSGVHGCTALIRLLVSHTSTVSVRTSPSAARPTRLANSRSRPRWRGQGRDRLCPGLLYWSYTAQRASGDGVGTGEEARGWSRSRAR
jgi:hypothetical protein